MKVLGLIITGLSALSSVALGHVYLTRLEAEVSGGAKVPVLVAAKDLPVGQTLAEDMLAVRDIPEAYLEARHVRATDVAKVVGARVAGGLKAQEALLWSDVSSYNERGRGLAGLVERGLRAIALDGRVAAFRGLLRPGDHVDVVFSSGINGEAGSTMTLLQNLLVLSVGNSLSAEDEVKKLSTSDAVTLGVTVEQAQILVQAGQRGRLTLTLRNSEDVTLVEGLPETVAAGLTPSVAPAPVSAVTRQKGPSHVR